MQVGDKVTYTGKPPLTRMDRILWRLFRIERKRSDVLQNYVVTAVHRSEPSEEGCEVVDAALVNKPQP